MIHARRIKSKRKSTKEMLENTVSSNTRAEKVRVEQIPEEQAREALSPNAIQSAGHRDMSVKSSFSRFTRKTGNKNKLKVNQRVKHQETKPQMPMQRFLKRLAYLAIFCALAFVLLSLSFRTESLVIQGNQNLTVPEVQNLSRIQAGTPLLWVSERNVKNLLRNPWVDNVKINRVFPHTVLIELTERTPVALFNANLSGEQISAGTVQNQIAYSVDGRVLPNVPVEMLDRLTPINGWGEDRSFEGLELLNYLNKTPELSVTKIDYTPEGFEASFEYGLFESSSQETSFILGQLQTPSLTLLKEHWSAFVHALATSETGELRNMAGSLENGLTDRLIVPAPPVGGGQDDQETRRIVKRKWITVYGWGVSLSE